MSQRNISVDTTRAAALIGICVVNLHFLGLPAERMLERPEVAADRFVGFLVEFLFQGKFFLLFSFLFGWGLQIQIVSAARAGKSFAALYFRRLTLLAVFGCLHAILVFTGDILLVYAVLGLLLWPFRNHAPDRLMRIATAMIPVAMVGLTVLAVLLSGDMAPSGSHSLGGGFREGTLARISDWPGTFGFLLLFQGPLAFGAFLAGLAAAKADFFAADSVGRRRLARSVPMLLLVAIPLNLLFALAPQDGDGILTLASLLSFALAAPLLSAVYLHGLLWLSARIALPDLLILAGRNSLTAYVLQGVIAGAIFGAYGLGHFGEFGQATLLPVSIGIALAAMACTGLMARYWTRAPLEHFLRRFTYGPKA